MKTMLIKLYCKLGVCAAKLAVELIAASVLHQRVIKLASINGLIDCREVNDNVDSKSSYSKVLIFPLILGSSRTF